MNIKTGVLISQSHLLKFGLGCALEFQLNFKRVKHLHVFVVLFNIITQYQHNSVAP